MYNLLPFKYCNEPLDLVKQIMTMDDFLHCRGKIKCVENLLPL